MYSKLSEIEKDWLYDFATRSFRDSADSDYIAARLCYRNELYPSFLWTAHQAIEKYLKAALVLNESNARHLGHDLRKAAARLETIDALGFMIPQRLRLFVEFLDDWGFNRYLEIAAFARPLALLDLDWTVWFIRRYCQPLSSDLETSRAICEENSKKHPISVALRDGELERILALPNHSARPQLVWKNPCFGRRRTTLHNYPTPMWAMNPTHVVQPQAFPTLAKYIDFSAKVAKAFNALPQELPSTH